MKITIIDDDQLLQHELHQQLAALLKDRFELHELKREDFQSSVDVLAKRRADLLNNGSFDLAEECAFDSAQVLIVENDLTQFHFGYTAEFVAYHARCFSRCGFIVGVDQYGKNCFDLTLRDHPQSFADLNVGSKQLANPGLWNVKDWGAFRPWAWPLIPDAVERLERRATALTNQLDEPLFPTIGFKKEITELLPREIIEFVSRKKEISEFPLTTIRDFLFDSENGLERKDAFDNKNEVRRVRFPAEIQCRIAAARLAKWLECLVLPCQDIIVDAPHLVRRFPSLLQSGDRSLSSVNETAFIVAVTDLPLKREVIEVWRFTNSDWISRPVWFFEEMRRSDPIAEVKDPWTNEPLDFVFCEDTSQFVSEGEARPFEAELPTPDTRRWVKDLSLEGVSYEPEVRFAL